MKYRLYIDEVGNPDLGASRDPNHRYLSLTGVIMELEYVRTDVFPAIESLKERYFGSHPDDPLILHRKELINKRYPFKQLRDPEIERRFNEELLTLLRKWDYTVITTVIDKLEHQQRYTTWRYDPYHYCLKILVERYVLWLEQRNEIGDVMAESRGGKEDRRLKDSFSRLYEDGTDFIQPDKIARYLTSKQLKVKPKSNNIAGLQIADLIAHPSFKATQARQDNKVLPENFGGKIAAILEELKYYRSSTGRINGWGRKWLP
ncbi:MAG: DUF3800 domain-containing protein [Candidatus Promineifilaceae bacterium]